MKEKDSIKYTGSLERKGSENWEKKTVATRIVLIINIKDYIQELIFSDGVDDDFLR